MRKYDLNLPRFTKEQSELLKNSVDFIGLNHYTSYFATYDKLSLENNDFSWSGAMQYLTFGLEKNTFYQVGPHFGATSN
jgi:beta-glucosidase/6-phospho-beta-glucosidase/beta-galactosidase